MPGCNGAGVAERSYPTSEVRSGGPRGATPHPRSGAAAERSNPTSKERQPTGATTRPRSGRRAKRIYSMFKVRRVGHEEIPLVQGKEQWLPFAGADVKRYPTFKVRETQVRGYMLLEGIRGQTH